MLLRRGLTVVEVLVALAVLLTLAGLLLVVTVPARESAKQASCMSQLRQIHVALQLYATDYPECVYGDTVTFVDNVMEPLSSYGMTKQLYYCPDTPATLDRNRIASTYFWNSMLGSTADSREWQERREYKIKKMIAEASSYVVVECDVHDQIFFQPRERDVDPSLMGAYRIQLLAGGSVLRRRTSEPRTQLFLGGS